MLWKQVSQRLNESGIPASSDNCDRKWRNLKIRYKQILNDKGRKEESKCQWEYYTAMQLLFSENTENKPARNLRPSRILQPHKNIKSNDVVEDNKKNIKRIEILQEASSTVNIRDLLNEDSKEASEEKIILGKRERRIDLDDSSLAERKKLSAKSRRKKKTPLLGGKVDKHLVPIKSESVADIILIDVEDEIDEDDHNVMVAASENNINDAQDQNDNIKLIGTSETEATPPIWFQNFMIRYESDTKMLQDKVNQILDRQSFAKVIINNLNNKVNKLGKQFDKSVQEQ